MTAHVTGTHVRIAAREREGERVVLNVGPENDALGERVHIGGCGSGALQFASGQGALADVADGDAAGFRGAAAADRRTIRIPDVRRREKLSCPQPSCWSGRGRWPYRCRRQ
jgi:hypothetical protein